MSSRSSKLESGESGWISMVDLLIVLCCIGAALALVSIGDARKSLAEQAKGDLKIATLQERVADLEKESGDLRVRLDEESERSRSFRVVLEDSLGDSTIDPSSLDEIIRNHRRFEDAERKVAELSSAVAEAVERERSAVEQRDGLDEKLRELDARSKSVQEELKQVRRESTAATEQLSKAEDRAREADERANSERTRASTADESLRQTQGELSAAKFEIQSSGEIRQELLGIPGRVTNTVFVIDRSESMDRARGWEAAKSTVASWIKHLPVSRASMVVFGSDVKVIPEALDSATGRVPDSVPLPELDPQLRETMLRELSALSPTGQTRTAAALRRAMEFSDVNAIIVFTDGEPDDSDGGQAGDPRQRVIDMVAAWRASHPNGRVHIVGISDYFRPPMRDFLLGVARAGDGAFIGR